MVLAYRLQSQLEPAPVRAGFPQGTVTVSVSTEAAQARAGSDEVGIDAQSGALTISIEKDFRLSDSAARRAGTRRLSSSRPAVRNTFIRELNSCPSSLEPGESDFTNSIGMLGDCHRRIERFLEVLVRVAEQAHGEALNEEQRGALDTALHYRGPRDENRLTPTPLPSPAPPEVLHSSPCQNCATGGPGCRPNGTHTSTQLL